jgi:E3 ubiquitin-protein ligase UBR4
MKFRCDGCGYDPIMTQRWHCDLCLDFDFCDACHNERDLHDLHNHEHSMSAISVPDGFLEIVPGRGGEHALKKLMKHDPHLNFNLWCLRQSH